MPIEAWGKLISKERWNNIQLRDSRYSQVIHMVTAAKGAEEFYTTEEHSVRDEGPELARILDDKVAQVLILPISLIPPMPYMKSLLAHSLIITLE